MRTLLNDSQVDLNQLTHPSCTLQVPCGSLLSVAVEARADDLSLDNARGTGKPCVVVIKSSNISLLARARLALTQRVQVYTHMFNLIIQVQSSLLFQSYGLNSGYVLPRHCKQMFQKSEV